MLTRVRVGKLKVHVRQRAGMGDRRQIVDYEAYQKREKWELDIVDGLMIVLPRAARGKACRFPERMMKP